jgi:hypothetical protein
MVKRPLPRESDEPSSARRPRPVDRGNELLEDKPQHRGRISTAGSSQGVEPAAEEPLSGPSQYLQGMGSNHREGAASRDVGRTGRRSRVRYAGISGKSTVTPRA